MLLFVGTLASLDTCRIWGITQMHLHAAVAVADNGVLIWPDGSPYDRSQSAWIDQRYRAVSNITVKVDIRAKSDRVFSHEAPDGLVVVSGAVIR